MGDITLGFGAEIDNFSTQILQNPLVQNLIVSTSGNIMSCGSQLIGTTKVNLELKTGHSTLGWAILLNTDVTNFVSFGKDADSPLGEMKAGEFAFFRISRAQSTLSLKADTLACTIWHTILDD